MTTLSIANRQDFTDNRVGPESCVAITPPDSGRREFMKRSIAAGGALLIAEAAGPVERQMAPPRRATWVRRAQFVKDNELAGKASYERIHDGKGSTGVKYFRFDRAPEPANFLVYDFPPGSSEGVHVHRLRDEKLGSFDEYYYIVSGSGQMEIDGQIVPVLAGDHVFTPLDVAHGIENTSKTEHLRVFLTFIERS